MKSKMKAEKTASEIEVKKLMETIGKKARAAYRQLAGALHTARRF